MKAAIIDDLSTWREEIRTCLIDYLSENYFGEIPVVESFESGEDFLSCFTANTYDIIFIDQYMREYSGIDTAQKIREQDALVALVFITTSREHAIDSYQVRACGYLVKPFQYEEFQRTMNLAGLDKIRNSRFISLGKQKILLREILWCNQDNHYVEVHTDKRGTLRFRLRFGDFSSLLAPYPQFLTCYKGCIVNMERAQCVDETAFLMDTGNKVPFSQRNRKKIETLFYEYLFQRERQG
ncbi:MAG: LytTR family DNA-binding domain-containing protein [Clostridium sp.]|nr:LytTR family DNA-binding domain-containing protein [Clostridium sp.]